MSRFVKHTGYGNAAGLLASRGLLGGHGLRSLSPEGQYSSDSDSDTEEYRKVKDRINPVTGRVESPQPDPMEGMSEEEKEEEARRLLMLFNKAAKSVERSFAPSDIRLQTVSAGPPQSCHSFTSIFMSVLQRQSNPGDRSGCRRKAGLNVGTDGKICPRAEGFWVGQ